MEYRATPKPFRTACLVAGLVMAVALLACGQPQPAATPSVPPSVLTPQAVPAPAPRDLGQIKAVYSSTSAYNAPLWLAKEAGLFEKHGLKVELDYISSGATVISALLAGEIQLAQGPNEAAITSALGGADTTIIASLISVPVYSIMTRSEIRGADQLRGKTLGVTRFGGTPDFILRWALKNKAGLDPESDVTIVQCGGLTECLAAIDSGAISGSAFTPPVSEQAKRMGLYEFMDVSKQGMALLGSAVVLRQSYLSANRDVVLAFLKGLVEGVRQAKASKEKTVEVIRQYARLDDPQALSDTYDSLAKYYNDVPYPTPASIQTILDQLGATDPKARGARPEQFVDRSVLKELEDTGFFRGSGGR